MIRASQKDLHRFRYALHNGHAVVNVRHRRETVPSGFIKNRVLHTSQKGNPLWFHHKSSAAYVTEGKPPLVSSQIECCIRHRRKPPLVSSQIECCIRHRRETPSGFITNRVLHTSQKGNPLWFHHKSSAAYVTEQRFPRISLELVSIVFDRNPEEI